MTGRAASHSGTLLEALDRAAASPLGIRVVRSSEQADILSYAELRDTAARWAGALQAAGLATGGHAIIIADDIPNFLGAFWACVWIGAIPVPLAMGPSPAHGAKLRNVIGQLPRPAVLYDSGSERWIDRYVLGDPESAQKARLMRVDQLSQTDPVPPANSRPDALAYLQYSSGSTGQPKGVTVTHEGLILNMAALHAATAPSAGLGYVGWLPLTHDMGLIGTHLLPLAHAHDQVLIPTATFIRNPLLWLQCMSQYHAGVSYSPNFGFQYCLSALMSTPLSAKFRLDHVERIINGAEPIQMQVCRAFLDTLAKNGLRNDVIAPAYGLAEATLAVTLHESGRNLRSETVDRSGLGIGDPVQLPKTSATALEIANCGPSISDITLRIADLDGQTLGDGHIGEIHIHGPTVTAGYFDVEEQPFTDDGWLKTGDLGYLRNGDLFVTGRLKDLLIVNGQNYYPHDLEQCLQQECDIPEGRVVVTQSPAVGDEGLIVFVSVKPRQAEELVQHIRRALFDFSRLAVAEVVAVRAIPKTTSGKLARQPLLKAFLSGELDGARTLTPAQPPKERLGVSALLHQSLSETFGLNDVSSDRPLMEQGLDSMRFVTWCNALKERHGIDLSPTLLFRFPTLSQLTDHLERGNVEPVREKSAGVSYEPIAVVGYACRFPQSQNPDEFWDLLHSGRDPVRDVPDYRWKPGAYIGSQKGQSYTEKAGFLEEIRYFDAPFFHISQAEAERMDPQQRLLLEVAWEAFEHAGLKPEQYHGSETGVVVGLSIVDYQAHLRTGALAHIDANTVTGTMHSIAAGRIAYTFDLRGPASTVDTACSSSLVAIHQACRQLQAGECSMALAGGVNLILTPESFVGLSELQALSPSGACRTFDADADGYVRGEGCGLVVLKRLSDALADGDIIHGVIRGSAVNQDGRSNGLTAPNGLAQMAVMGKALAVSGIAASQVSYIEAHGTGTKLGDPLEMQSMAEVYAREGAPLLVGSVKSNVGHLESAAGVAGLIKLLLAGQRGEIPGNLHFRSPNPLIAWSSLNMDVVGRNKSWTQPRRVAALSSFGFSGTNAHLVVETAEQPTPMPLQEGMFLLLPVSSHFADGAQQRLESMQTLASSHPERLPEYAHALLRESPKSHRGALLCRWNGHRWDVKDKKGPVFATSSLRVAFLFTGQGAQYPGMGKSLYETVPLIRQWFDRCEAEYLRLFDESLLEVMFAETGSVLEQTTYTQPATFMLSYGLYLWMESIGFRPEAVCGHSIGEYAAAAAAGVMDALDAFRLVAWRGKLMGDLPTGGGMLSIFASETEVRRFLDARGLTLEIAAVNSPTQTVVAGSDADLTAAEAALQSAGLHGVRLRVSHAFHSRLMDPMLAAFREQVAKVTIHPPNCDFVSTVTGKIASRDMLTDPEYWTGQVRSAVRFQDAAKHLAERGIQFALELGPSGALSGLMGQCGSLPSQAVMQRGKDATTSFLEALATAHTLGASLDLTAVQPWVQSFTPTSVPYAYQKREAWLNPAALRHDDRKAPTAETPPVGMYQILETPYDIGNLPRYSGSEMVLLRVSDADPSMEYDPVLGQMKDFSVHLGQVDSGQIIWDFVPHARWEQNGHEVASPPIGIPWVLWLPKQPVSESSPIFEIMSILRTSIDQFRPKSLWVVYESDADWDSVGNRWLEGLVRVLPHETEVNAITHVELASGDISPLAELLKKDLPPSLMKLRITEGQVKKLVYTAVEAASLNLSRAVNPQQWQVITGAKGGIATSLIEDLVRSGCSRLMLLARGETPEFAERRRSWEAQGARIEFRPGSVDDADYLERCLSEIPRGELGHVFQTAGAVRDALLRSVQPQQVEPVFAGKVLGTYHLANLLDKRVDGHLVLFSSVAKEWPIGGQALYAAANAMQTAIGLRFAAKTSRCTTVHWGPWRNVGMTSRQSYAHEQLGVVPMEASVAIDALRKALETGLHEVFVVDLTEDTRQSLLSEPNFARQDLQPHSRATVGAETFVTDMVRELLGLQADDPLDRQSSFFEIGFNSALLTRLSVKLNQGPFPGQVPISILFKHTSVAKLAEYLDANGTSAEKHEPGLEDLLVIDQPVDSEILQEVMSLSDEEIIKRLELE